MQIYTPECPNNRNQVLSHAGSLQNPSRTWQLFPAGYEYQNVAHALFGQARELAESPGAIRNAHATASALRSLFCRFLKCRFYALLRVSRPPQQRTRSVQGNSHSGAHSPTCGRAHGGFVGQIGLRWVGRAALRWCKLKVGVSSLCVETCFYKSPIRLSYNQL